jgi:hypothetical protein
MRQILREHRNLAWRLVDVAHIAEDALIEVMTIHVLPANCRICRVGLDSNQRPLPYQRSKSVSDASCLIRETSLFKAISAFSAPRISGSVRLRSGPVAAQLPHIPKSSGDEIRHCRNTGDVKRKKGTSASHIGKRSRTAPLRSLAGGQVAVLPLPGGPRLLDPGPLCPRLYVVVPRLRLRWDTLRFR